MAAEEGASGLEVVDTGGTSNVKAGLGDDEPSRCLSKLPSNASAISLIN